MASSCPVGYYCPNSSYSVVCGEGSYCPEATQQLKCPENYFCPEGMSAPIACLHISTCDAGGTVENKSVLIVLALASIVVLYVLVRVLHLLFLHSTNGSRKIHTSAARAEDHIQLALIAIDKHLLKKQMRFRGFHANSNPITVSFDNLQMSLRSTGAKVLASVTGEFRHSRMHAIMGPSGCGKSTFLNALSGRDHYGTTSGLLKINDMSVKELRSFSSEIGFGPQDDIVHDKLTVRENLEISASLRHRPGLTTEQIQNMVADAIQILQMSHIENSIVGSVENRGISGGERKRVSIGMELVTDPSLLMLDEPTSGLDSASTLNLLTSLRTISRLGINVIMVIHQPRYDAFTMFDSLLLLGVGGYQLYMGPAIACMPYFEHLGYKIEFGHNPADFFLDIITGLTEVSVGSGGKRLRSKISKVRSQESKRSISQALANKWASSAHAFFQRRSAMLSDEALQAGEIRDFKAKFANLSIDVDAMGDFLELCGIRDAPEDVCIEVMKRLDKNGDGKLDLKDFLVEPELETATQTLIKVSDTLIPRKPRGICRQIVPLARREYLVFSREWKAYCLRCLIISLPGFLQRGIYGQNWLSSNLNAIIVGCLLMATFVALSAPDLIIHERLLMRREVMNGVSIFSYYLSKTLLDIILCLLYSFSFFIPYAFLCTASNSFGTIYWNILMVVFYCHGLGILFAMLLKTPHSVCGLVLCGTGILFNHVMISPDTISSSFLALGDVTFLRWWVPSMFINEYKAIVDSGQSYEWKMVYVHVLNTFEFNSTDSYYGPLVLLGLGFAFRLLACLILIYKMSVLRGFEIVPLTWKRALLAFRDHVASRLHRSTERKD